MDISRIRKKLKKSRTPARQKTEKLSQEEEVKEVPRTADTKSERSIGVGSRVRAVPTHQDSETEIKQEDTKTKGEEFETEFSAIEGEAEAAPVKETEIMVFKIAQEEYAVKISELQEVLRTQCITAVPRSPRYLKGVTSIRGKILPVINLGERLGLGEKTTGKEKIIVLSAKKGPFGATVGAVLGVFKFPENELLPPPSTLTDEEKGFIEGVVKINNKFISILKVGEILKMEEL